MAIDTAAKRNSAIATRRLPWFRRFAPIPSGTVDAGDRQQLAFVYRGIESDEPLVREPSESRGLPYRKTSQQLPVRQTSIALPNR